MKQLFLAFAVCLLACNDSTKVASVTEASEPATAEQNRRNSQEVYRSIETGDVSKLDAFFADNVVDHNANPDGSDIVGRDSVKKLLAEIHQYFEGLKVTMLADATSADGQHHFTMVRMTGKAKQNPWGMPVGMEMDDTSVDVMKIKDGKITDHWGFMSQKDVTEWMTALSGNGAAKEK